MFSFSSYFKIGEKKRKAPLSNSTLDLSSIMAPPFLSSSQLNIFLNSLSMNFLSPPTADHAARNALSSSFVSEYTEFQTFIHWRCFFCGKSLTAGGSSDVELYGILFFQ